MAVNVSSQRLYSKKGFLDAGMMPKTYSEIEASKFNGMLVLCEDSSDPDHNGKYYCCIDGVVKEFKGTNLDKLLIDKERKELFKIVGGSFNQAIIDMLDKCNEEKIEGDRKDA